MKHVQNTSPGTVQLRDRATGKRFDLNPGITKMSQEEFAMFEEKITANPVLHACDPIQDVPVAKQAKVEEKKADELVAEAPVEASCEFESDAEVEDKKPKGKKK